MDEKEYTVSDRGFVYADDIIGDYGTKISVHQSSSVRPSLWVRLYSSAAYHPELPEGTEVVAHIGLEEAKTLRDQLDYLINLG